MTERKTGVMQAVVQAVKQSSRRQSRMVARLASCNRVGFSQSQCAADGVLQTAAAVERRERRRIQAVQTVDG